MTEPVDIKPHGSLRRKRRCKPLARGPGDRIKTRFSCNPCYLFTYGTLLTGTPERAINQLISDFFQPRCRAFIHGRLHMK